MITREYLIKINTKATKALNTYATFIQGDVNVNYFNISFLNGDNPLDLTQFAEIQIVFERSDGQIIAGNTLELIDAINGQARFLLGSDEVAIAGRVNASITFFGALNERLSSCQFYFNVVAEINADDVIRTSNQYSLLTNLIADVNGIKANKWYIGDIEPTADIGTAEDLYLNTSNGFIYNKDINNVWVYNSTLVGGSEGTELPTDGTAGQVLIKTVDGLAWQTPATPIMNHNNLEGIQGGVVSEYNHLTNTEKGRISEIKKVTYMSLENPDYVGEEGEIIIILE